jgi:hypothetical protein
MPLTYKGITPTYVVDTRPLQNTVAVAGTKWRKGTTGNLEATTGNEGICATLVSFWLSKRIEGTMITNVDQFPNRFQLSIAQSSYEIGGTRDSLLDIYGLSIVGSREKNKKWYMFKKTRVAEAVGISVERPGYYYLRITGDGGHALGIATQGTPQFLDPNIGILQFTSVSDLGKWVTAFVPDYYPELMKEVGLYAVGV